MSNLNVPNFQFSEVDVFAILSAIALPRARVSTLSVVLVIVKGPNEELADESLG